MGLLGSLIYNIKANTAELEKGSKRAKKEFGSIDQSAKQASAGIKAGFGNLAGTLAPGLGVVGNLNGAFKAGIGILKGATMATHGLKAALISSGIGAIVVALGVAFAGLSAWINRSTEGADESAKVWAVMSATFDAVLDKVAIIGSAIGKLLKGDFKGAADEAKRFVKESVNIFSEIKNEASEALELQKMENKLRNDKINFLVTEAKLKDEISQLEVKAKDSEISAEKRAAANLKVQQLIKQLYGEKAALAEVEHQIQKRRNAMGDTNYENLEKEKQLERDVFLIHAEKNNAIKSTLRLQGTLNKQIEKEWELQKKANEVKPLEKMTIQSEIQEPVLPKSLDLLNVKIDESKRNFLDFGKVMTETALGQGVNAVNSLGDAFGELLTGQKGALKGFISSTLEAIRSVINGLFAQAIAGQIASNSKFGLPGLALASIGIGAVSALFKAKVPEFATGGTMPYSGMATVGERGPEQVYLPKGSRVLNNIESRQNQSGGTLTARVSGTDLMFILEETTRRKTNTF